MRPVMTSPCSSCGITLVHDQDPRKVLCGGCVNDIALSKNLTPPPTTEPPKPPPMRTMTEPMVPLAFLPVILVVALIFYAGMKFAQ